MAIEFKPQMLSLVRPIAKKWHRKNPMLDYDDIFQEGCIGLINGLSYVDEDQKWQGFLSKRIRYAIFAYIRQETMMKRDYRLTMHATEDWLSTKQSAKEIDLDLPIIRKKIVSILTEKQKDTFDNYFMLGKSSAEIARERGNKTKQAVLEQIWKIKAIAIEQFGGNNDPETNS